MNNSLIKVYTIKDIKQKSDNPHGIIVINGITIPTIISLFVQFLFIDKVSL